MAPFTREEDEKTEAKHEYPRPLLRLEVLDLSNAGGVAFLRAVNPDEALQKAVKTVLETLYPHGKHSAESDSSAAAPVSPPPTPWPGTRSVTLVVDPYRDGVAYTTGKNFDSDHKEIHLMTGYVSAIPAGRLAHELHGVLVHEMVHCWQWAAHGTASVGLTEGVADWVRLRAGLAPPHWTRRHGADDEWDAGYAVTAFFLDWLEERFGAGTVVRVNAALRHEKQFEAEGFFKEVLGEKVSHLWKEYCTKGPGKWHGEGEGQEGSKGSKEEGS